MKIDKKWIEGPFRKNVLPHLNFAKEDEAIAGIQTILDKMTDKNNLNDAKEVLKSELKVFIAIQENQINQPINKEQEMCKKKKSAAEKCLEYLE